MAKVTYDKKMRQVMLHSHKIEDIDGLTNPLRFQGEITTDFDSSIISGLDNGWFYTIKTTPSGQTVTDTNTGQVFKDKDEIAWDGAKWVIIGNESEIDSSKWANIDVQFDKGLLYNGFNSSMVDILPSGFFIPSLSVWNDLITIAGGQGTAGQRLKSLLGWTSVYPGDTNNLNFNATGTGVRVTAEFNGESQTTYFLASETNGAEHSGVIFRHDVPNAIVLTAGAGGIPRTHGVSIRGVRSATAEELLLADGASAGIVKDYDGNYYRTVKIGFNVWMADNLKTTHENDGTPLVQVQDQTAWTALTSPAYCYYNNTDIVVLDTIESNYIEPINNRKFSKSHIYDYTETPTSLTNTIFVDATRGDDATADGSIAKPYKTPEQAVADFDPVVLAFVGDIISGTNYITVAAGVTPNLKEGQLIVGTGIPFDTRVVSLALYSITLSNNVTATSVGESFEAWVEASIEAYGDFKIASNIYKQGIISYDFNGVVSVGAIAMLDMGSVVVKTHLKFKCQKWLGLHAGSRFFTQNLYQDVKMWVDIDVHTIQSKGTGYVFEFYNSFYYDFTRICNANIKCAYLETAGMAINAMGGSLNYTGDVVATLGVISARDLIFKLKGNITVPSGISGILFRSATARTRIDIEGDMLGFGNYTLYGDVYIKGRFFTTTSTIETNSCVIDGQIAGNMTFTSGDAILNVTNEKSIYSVNTIITNTNCRLLINMTSNFYQNARTIQIIQNGNITIFNGVSRKFRFDVNGGKLITHGYHSLVERTLGVVVTGGIWENHAEIISNNTVTYLNLFEQSGGVIRNFGILKNEVVRKTSPLGIISGGVFESRNGHISTANGMPPIRCIGSAQDIRWFNGTTNSDTINSIEKGYGKVIYVRVTTTETDTQFDLFDGTNTETFSVVGAGLTREQIAQQFVTDILASTLNFEYVEIGGAAQGLGDFDIQIVGLEEQPILASALTNATTAVRVDFGYAPNFLHKINLVEDPTLD